MARADMKTYYPNGKVQTEITADSQKTYYEDGKVMMEVTLRDGNPVGVAKTYYPDGKLMREDDHEKKHWKQYDPAGHLLAEGDME